MFLSSKIPVYKVKCFFMIMKKILAVPEQTFRETTKRSLPETWYENYNKEEETKQEEERRLFKEIKRDIRYNHSNNTIIKRRNSFNVTKILSDLSLYSSFVRVIYLVDTSTGLFPLEAYSKADALELSSNRTVKKARYTFKSQTPIAILNNSLKIVSSIYEIEGKYVSKGVDYLGRKAPLARRLLVLEKLVKLSISLDRPVLDPASIYVQEEGNINILYIPMERINVNMIEYMIFLVGLLVNPYTVMERVDVIRKLSVVREDKVSEGVERILVLLYDGMKSTKWAKSYSEIAAYIVQYMNTIQ